MYSTVRCVLQSSLLDGHLLQLKDNISMQTMVGQRVRQCLQSLIVFDLT